MRNLADFQCPCCESAFYRDLSSGQGLYTPVLLHKKSGEVSGGESAEWFADWLRNSYAERSDTPLDFGVREFADITGSIVLLNCLDVLYGHSLLKLLNAQRHIVEHPDRAVIAIVPKYLAWMLPEGLAEAWIIDLPLRRGTEWNDWLAAKIAKRVESFSEVYLSKAFSHPNSSDFDIKNFTGVEPFPLDDNAKADKPIVTFIYREDRMWGPRDARKVRPLATLFNRAVRNENDVGRQMDNIIEFAEALRQAYGSLDFAVVGFGEPGGLPGWILDMRRTSLEAEDERSWCRRYAASHLVIGVHGSNMLLPSAHARSVIDIIDRDRWGNILQDLVVRGRDARDALFRYRHVSNDITPADLAELALTVLRYDEFRALMPSNP